MNSPSVIDGEFSKRAGRLLFFSVAECIGKCATGQKKDSQI